MGQQVPPPATAFVEGQTRVNAVVQELGPPICIGRLPDGCAFLYEYSLITEFQLGISVDIPVVHWFKFLKAWNNLHHQALLLTFDNQGVLRSVGTGNFKESLGGGTGVQFLFAVMSFSDSSKYLRP